MKIRNMILTAAVIATGVMMSILPAASASIHPSYCSVQ